MNLAEKHILITAGPTREMIDPVRFLSNRSSGKMGYALAEVACDLSARVTLVSGPTALTLPENVNCISVVSADDMLNAVMKLIDTVDIFIACAAVSDYKPAEMAHQKIKKTEDNLTLTLVRTPDILKTVASLDKKPLCIGFAAETHNIEHYALNKLKEKRLDMVIANEVNFEKGFERDNNAATLYHRDGRQLSLEEMAKNALAKHILSTLALWF